MKQTIQSVSFFEGVSKKKFSLKQLTLCIAFIFSLLISANKADAQYGYGYYSSIEAYFGGYYSGCNSLCLQDESYDFDYYCEINAWHWDFGDGNSSSEENPCYTYAAAGTYDITFTVYDNCGDSGSISYEVSVGDSITAGPVGIYSSDVCVGTYTYVYTDGDGGGTWSSSDTTVATVDSLGNVFGISAGTANITYFVSGSCGSDSASASVTVENPPKAGTVTLSSYVVCAGSTIIAVSDGDTGGVWSSSYDTIATVDSAGTVTGVSADTAVITYTVSNVCSTLSSNASVIVTDTATAGTITGAVALCTGGTTTLSDVTGTGIGTWSSSDTTIATVDGSGNVAGLLAGSAVITYSVTSTCGTASTNVTVTVSDLLPLSPIAGEDTLCAGSETTLTDTAGGGTWSSSDAGVVTVDASGKATSISAGTATITYTLSCLSGTSSISATIVVDTLAANITGTTEVCLGTTTTLSDATAGGIWSGNDTTIATIDSSGNVTSLSAGGVDIFYNLTNACGSSEAAVAFFVDTTAGPIMSYYGDTDCTGYYTILYDAAYGGTWTSSDPDVVFVDIFGYAFGRDAGVATITYTITNACGTSGDSIVIVNDTLAAAITGTTEVCTGSVTTLSDIAPGGIWSSNDSTIATVDSLGNVTGIAQGTATVVYTLTNICGISGAAAYITVDAPAAAIMGLDTICADSSTTLVDTIAGGTWATSDATIAAVDASGNVTGIAVGVATITYSLTNICGTTSASVALTIEGTAAVITGIDTTCVGSATTLSDATAGGVWTTSDETTATVDASGNVTGVAIGTATITYTVTNSCGASSSSATVTIQPLPVPVIIQTDSVLSTTLAYSSYQWLLGDTSISGATSGTHKMTTDGNYSVVVTNSSGCTDTSAVLDVTTLAVNNISGTNSIQIYPNPAQLVVHVQAAERVDVRITTIDGSLLREIPNAKDIDISGFADGVYLIEVYNEQGIKLKTGRIVKAD